MDNKSDAPAIQVDTPRFPALHFCEIRHGMTALALYSREEAVQLRDALNEYLKADQIVTYVLERARTNPVLAAKLAALRDED